MSNSISASAEFHAAIKAGAKQRALVYFYDDNLFFTNDDITADGLHYENYFNTEEDISISGTPPSASISFSVFNEKNRLDRMKYGRFKASIAAMVGFKTYERVGQVTVHYEGDVISGHNDYPYFRINGSSIANQPTSPVASILAHDGFVYCVGKDGQVTVYEKAEESKRGRWGTVSKKKWNQVQSITWQELLNITSAGGQYSIVPGGTIAVIMIPAVLRYASKNIGIAVIDDATVEDYLPDGTVETYEYVDLGVFYADRPERTKTEVISIQGYDAMVKFDVSTDGMSIRFPITLRSLLDSVCSYVGIQNKVSGFINQDIVIDENADIFQNTTAREIVGYIAEAACSVARIDYDGKLVFSWWEESDLSINESDYSSFVPYEYKVKRIDRLQVRSSESDIGILVGDGTNGYVIQENPFLIFDSDADGRKIVDSIYERLSAFEEYTPGSVKWFADWSYRPGDIINIKRKNVTYRYPVFGYTLDWSGNAIATLESTGNELRDVMDVQHREEFQIGRKVLEIKKSIDGVSVIASEAKRESGEAITKASKAEQDASGIRTEVSSYKEAVQGYEEAVSTYEQTVNGFKNEVSQYKKSVDGYEEATASYGASVDGYSAELKSYKDSVDGYEKATASYGASVDGFKSEVSGYKEAVGGYQTTLQQTQGEISAKVSKNSIINEINLSHESAKIKAPKIEFDGAVITNGSLETGNWKFDENGSNYQQGGQGINMTIMSGDFVGGGSGTRAFFGSTGLDVQYGSDYNRNTYIRSGNVIVIAQNPEEISEFATAKFIRSDSGEMSFVCGESTGSSTTDTNSSGNLGAPDQYWDYTFTRVLRAGTYPGSSSKAIKKDIKELPEMGEIIDRLVPVSFAYKSEPDKPRYGLIYEDTKQVMPVICFDDGKGDPGIVYTDLIAPLLKEIQSLRKRIKFLEERV